MPSDSAEFPIRLHLHLHPRPGRPFPPLHLHLYDEYDEFGYPCLGPRGAAPAPDDGPVFEPYADRGMVSISQPGSGSPWNVRPDSSGSSTGYICAWGLAYDSNGPASIVYAKAYSAFPGDTPVLTSDAVSTTCIKANGSFLFDNVANSTEIPNVLHSSGGGTPNWLVVWAYKGSGNSVAMGIFATQFMGVTSAQTNCQASGMSPMAIDMPTGEEVVVQSRCQALGLDDRFLPESEECALLVQAVTARPIILEKELGSSLAAPVWCGDPSGRLGGWRLELGRAASGFVARLKLCGCQGISTHEEFVWSCSDWCPRRANVFVPTAPDGLRARLPSLRVQAT